MKAEEIAAIMEIAEEYRPVVDAGLELLKSYGPQLKSLAMDISLASVDIKIEMIHKYTDAGFTKEEAMYMVANDTKSLTEAMRSANVKK